MNLGSIIGLGSVCQPFPAGLMDAAGRPVAPLALTRAHNLYVSGVSTTCFVALKHMLLHLLYMLLHLLAFALFSRLLHPLAFALFYFLRLGE